MKKILYLLFFASTLSFGQVSDALMTTKSNQIRDETVLAANTKTRFSALFSDLINSKIHLSQLSYAIATGTNDYTITISPVPPTLTGLKVFVLFTNGNNAATTINVNGYGLKNIIDETGVQVTSGIPSNAVRLLVYNGTDFQFIGSTGGGGGGGSGTVTSVSVTTSNGVSGSVATATTTPAISLTLGAITPTSIAAIGSVTGSNLSGTNTGDQTNISGNAATVTTNANLTGVVTSVGNATSIANGAITNAMLANGAVVNLSGTNTGDQTSIVGITGTLAQFNTALTDGDFVSLAGSESITNKKLGSLTSNGFVKTSGGDGTLSVDANSYIQDSRTITVNGTSGNVTSSAGAQDLSVNRTWTLDLATAGTAGTYKSVTTDNFGRVTSGTNPTTLSGYGITDAWNTTGTTTVTNPTISGKFVLTSGTLVDGVSALSSTATFPTVMSGTNTAYSFTATGAGSSSFTPQAMIVSLASGYTGSSVTNGLNLSNTSAGTSASYSTSSSYKPSGNRALVVNTIGTSTGINTGGNFAAYNGDTNYGVWGSSTVLKNGATNVGVYGTGLNTGTTPINIGGFFGLVDNGTSAPTLTSAALMADNGATTDPIFIARDNGTITAGINDGGRVFFGGTAITSGSVALDIQNTTRGLLLPRVTNQASITTPVNGMLAYDAATNLFNAYENSAWQIPVFLTKTQTLTNKTLTSPQLNGALLETSSTAGYVWTATNTTGAGSWQALAGGGDMVLASTQTVTGAKTFNDTRFFLRNVANTFNGSFVNNNTADRVYTLKDAAGTLAFTSDITGTNSGTNTGDQTSIVGITGTKAQYNTSATDGDFLFVGDVTQYTDEMAQDATGAMVDASLTYVDGTPLLQRAALTGAITATAGSNATSLGSFTISALSTAISDANISGTNTGDQTITLTGGVTGSGTGSFAATVITNANLTGIVTSTGNATAIADGAISYTKLANGTDGELITWNSSGVASTVPVGTATHVLTSNGPGAAPTFQVAPGGGSGLTYQQVKATKIKF